MEYKTGDFTTDPVIVGGPFIVQWEAVRYLSIPRENNRIIGCRNHVEQDNKINRHRVYLKATARGVLAMCSQRGKPDITEETRKVSYNGTPG